MSVRVMVHRDMIRGLGKSSVGLLSWGTMEETKNSQRQTANSVKRGGPSGKK